MDYSISQILTVPFPVSFFPFHVSTNQPLFGFPVFSFSGFPPTKQSLPRKAIAQLHSGKSTRSCGEGRTSLYSSPHTFPSFLPPGKTYTFTFSCRQPLVVAELQGAGGGGGGGGGVQDARLCSHRRSGKEGSGQG